MKKLFTAMMLASVSAAPMTAQTNVSTEPQLKKALLEEYTGIHCGNCPDGHRYAAKLHLAQPNKFYTMCIHAGHYAEANTALGEPDYTTEMGDALNTEFGVSGYPSGIINRHEFSDYGTVLSRSYWGACAREITSEIAPVNLWIEASYDKNNRTLLVNVEGYLTSDLTGEDVTLTVALAQNYIQGPQSGGLVGNEYMHRHMLRDYITPGLWGEALNVSAKGQYFEKSYTYIVPEAIKEIPVVPTDLEVIAFVTEGKREILNVEDCAVNCEGVTVDIAPEISASKLGTARGYGYNFFEMYVTNRSSEPIETATFDVTFNGETTQVNWDGEIPAHSENVAIQIPVKWDNTQNANKYAVTMTKANNKAVSTATLSGSYDAVLEAPAKMQVEIRTDRFASDDRYLIRDSKGAIVKEFGPYADGTQSVYTEEISLEGNRNYCLEVQDAWADGVMSPRGYVKLYDMDKNLVAQQLEIKDHGCRIFFKTQAPQAENTEWSNEPIDLFPENYLTYSTEMMAGPGGTTWYVVDHPAGADEYDTDNMVYEFRVQAVDKNGKKLFGEDGLLISNENNRSYTVCNQILLVDKDDNAIVAVHDARNSSEGTELMSYTVYKISPSGEMLWGEEGVAVDGGDAWAMEAHMSMCQMADGSYVFAWQRQNSDSGFCVELQRVSANGELLWNADETRITAAKNTFEYPYIVDAGDNQVIVVFTQGTSQDIYARKLDFDGSKVWAEDARIYRGGWGSIPLWTLLSVVPSGDGGVLCAWNDDRAYTNIESAYLSYVTSDGKIGFSGASAEGDVKLGYSGYRAFNVKPLALNGKFYAVWRETDADQTYQALKLQCVSKSGELLWNEEGVNVEDLSLSSMGYINLCEGAEGQIAPIYMKRVFTDPDNFAIYDTEVRVKPMNADNGEAILDNLDDDDSFVVYSNAEAASLTACAVPAEKFWVMQWNDGIHKERQLLQRVNFDCKFVPSGVEVIENAEGDEFTYTLDGFKTATDGEIEVYDLTGAKVGSVKAAGGRASWTAPAAGIYVARMGDKAIKFAVK